MVSVIRQTVTEKAGVKLKLLEEELVVILKINRK